MTELAEPTISDPQVGGGAPAADPAAADPAGSGAAEPVAPAAEPAAAGAPQIDWNDINTLNEAAQRIAALGYEIQPITQPAAPEPPAYDPFDQASVDRYLEAKVNERLQQAVGPLAQQFGPIQEFVRAQQAEAVTSLIDGRIEAAIGAAELAPEGFGSEQELHSVVNALGNNIAAERIASLGRQPQGAEAQRLGEECIAEAVKILKDYGEARAAAGVEAYKASFGRSNILDPPVRGAGLEGAEPPQSELEVARRFMATK